ncbi:MAG: replication-associated recombination protein A, partial [Gammaproteobacteria bacterium]|nr:replication-associated recombination protein A [Gammaproteobacteria bacterium]
MRKSIPVPSDFRPLADRLRPRTLDEFVGQRHLVGEGKPLRRAIASGRLHSMVLWGPPGSGKTTLARIMAGCCRAKFLTLSAVLAGVKDIRDAVAEAKAHRADHRAQDGGDTVLFVDEVHRFNKAQQDAFLPFVENGTLTFIGATTENPSFELNNALLSRTRVYVLKPLTGADVRRVIDRALADRTLGIGALQLGMPETSRTLLASTADGDARRALNVLEMAADLAATGEDEPQADSKSAREQNSPAVIDDQLLREVLEGGGTRRFDKGGDMFYDQISALHKSVRGTDPDAALYWLARMLDGGCDPRYVARRLVRMASEDIGTADPRALALSLDAWEVQERLGSPEGELALAHATVYLACAAKSNAVYTAFTAARKDAAGHGSLEVPLHLRNAPTRLMKELGAGKDYRYAHDEPEAYAVGEMYFPEELGQRSYYQPTDRGMEKRIAEKLAWLRSLGSNPS